MRSAADWITRLRLVPHPEGGHFRESYRAAEGVAGPLSLFVIDPAGDLREVALGPDPERGEVLQAAVPAGAWFGAAPAPDTPYSLVGCTVAPGFEFADFEVGDRRQLARRYAQHAALVERLAR
jgi:predicted cupin superfamily sugar epimerase